MGFSLPSALREWYSLAGAMDRLSEVSGTHRALTLAEISDNTDLMQRYATTAPSSLMLPVMFENQGVWHLAIPLDGGDDPPVYLGYQEEHGFEWHMHAPHFSSFVAAWVWDYVTYARDYLVNGSQFFAAEDVATMRRAFQSGPTTYITNGTFNAERFERYARADQKITILNCDEHIGVWFSAEAIVKAIVIIFSLPESAIETAIHFDTDSH